MRTLPPLLVLALVATACAHGRHATQASWVEVRSPHFTLLVDAPEKEARALALDVERIHQALLVGTARAGAISWRAARVIVLADAVAMRSFFPKGLAGFSTSDVFGAPILVTHAEQSPSELPILKHELAHAVNNRLLLRQPRWLSEGLAVSAETIHLAPDGSSATGGALELRRVAQLQTMAAFDFGGAMAMGPELWRLPPRDVDDFYARAWLLVRVLADEHGPGFEQFLLRLSRGEEPSAAFAASLPDVTPQRLEDEALRWLKRANPPLLRSPLEPAANALATSEVPPEQMRALAAELDWFAARLASETPELHQRALEAATRTLQSSPGHPTATALRLSLEPLPPAERLLLARAAVAAHPDEPHAWSLLADALPAGTPPSDLVLEARRNAVAHGAGDALAHAALARTLAERGQAQEAGDLATTAVRLASDDPAVLQVAALAFAGAGRCPEAIAAGRRALETLPDTTPPDDAALVQTNQRALETNCAARTASPPEPAPPPEAPLPQAASPPHVAARAQPQRTCRTPGPAVSPRQLGASRLTVAARFTIDTRGRVGNVRVEDETPPAVAQAITAYLEGCQYSVGPGLVLPAEQGEQFVFERPSGRAGAR